jgi:hypothetical protein
MCYVYSCVWSEGECDSLQLWFQITLNFDTSQVTAKPCCTLCCLRSAMSAHDCCLCSIGYSALPAAIIQLVGLPGLRVGVRRNEFMTLQIICAQQWDWLLHVSKLFAVYRPASSVCPVGPLKIHTADNKVIKPFS